MILRGIICRDVLYMYSSSGCLLINYSDSKQSNFVVSRKKMLYFKVLKQMSVDLISFW
jgi:hypothetical protein